MNEGIDHFFFFLFGNKSTIILNIARQHHYRHNNISYPNATSKEKMFTRLLPIAARTASTRSVLPRLVSVHASRGFSTVGVTAGDAAELSGYNKIDFTIDEDSTVLDAVQRFVAHNIGCLVTVNSKGDLTGIISERDYIKKIELLDRTNETKIKEIYTLSSKLITAKPDESVEHCMEKMLASNIRHLPLVKNGQLLGMVSIKDLVKTTVQEKEETIKVLTDFALGKGSYAM